MIKKEDIRNELVNIIEYSINNAERLEDSLPRGVSIIEEKFPHFSRMRDIEEYRDVSIIYSIIDEYEDAVSHGFTWSDDLKKLLLISLEYLKQGRKIDDPEIALFFKRRK